VCVDYRELNQYTIKNQNALPNIREIMSRLAKTRIISIVNVIAAFNIIRIKEGNKYKTAFLTRFRLYKYIVILFRLCNALGTF
jgi:hypothetical protein